MICKRWVKVVLDLKEGTIEMEGNGAETEQHPHIARCIEDLRRAYAEMVEARQGRRFDVASVSGLMDGFHGMCVAY